MDSKTVIGFALIFVVLSQCAQKEETKATTEVLFSDLDARNRKYVSVKPPKRVSHKNEVRFGDYLVLLGYDVSDTKFRPGDVIEVTWYWKCLRPVAAGWQLFTHGVKGDREIVLNSDTKGVQTFASVRKKFPPSDWRPQTYIEDIQKLRIPEDFSVEQFELRVGVWLGNDRVPIRKGSNDGGNRARGAVLKMKPPKKLELVVNRTRESPKIDGEISGEDAWDKALKVGGFKEIIGGKKANYSTDLRLMVSDDDLYIAVIAADRFLAIPKNATGDELWKGDALTLLLDPGGDEKDYYEIQINPGGEFHDARFSSYRISDPSWNSNLEYAWKLDGTLDDESDKDIRWQGELKIPLDSLGKRALRKGNIWHVNFFRTDVQKEGTEYSAWSPPLRGDFHYFKKFGKMTLGD